MVRAEARGVDSMPVQAVRVSAGRVSAGRVAADRVSENGGEAEVDATTNVNDEIERPSHWTGASAIGLVCVRGVATQRVRAPEPIDPRFALVTG